MYRKQKVRKSFLKFIWLVIKIIIIVAIEVSFEILTAPKKKPPARCSIYEANELLEQDLISPEDYNDAYEQR